MSSTKHFAALGMTLLIALAPTAQALKDDQSKPIEIEADSLDVDERNGRTVYQGNVVLTQGSIRISATKVTVLHPKRKAQRVVAVGTPVRFKQLQDDKKTWVTAKANRAEYDMNGEILVLTGKAHLTRGKDSVRSDKIVYNRAKAKVQGGKVGGGKQRVKMTIFQAPKGLTGGKKEKPKQ